MKTDEVVRDVVVMMRSKMWEEEDEGRRSFGRCWSSRSGRL
jgi:hypothetical protein